MIQLLLMGLVIRCREVLTVLHYLFYYIFYDRTTADMIDRRDDCQFIGFLWSLV